VSRHRRVKQPQSVQSLAHFREIGHRGILLFGPVELAPPLASFGIVRQLRHQPFASRAVVQMLGDEILLV
jgi:hypothetical protein